MTGGPIISDAALANRLERIWPTTLKGLVLGNDLVGTSGINAWPARVGPNLAISGTGTFDATTVNGRKALTTSASTGKCLRTTDAGIVAQCAFALLKLPATPGAAGVYPTAVKCVVISTGEFLALSPAGYSWYETAIYDHRVNGADTAVAGAAESVGVHFGWVTSANISAGWQVGGYAINASFVNWDFLGATLVAGVLSAIPSAGEIAAAASLLRAYGRSV